MITCTHCGSDDIALQESNKLESAKTKEYRFIVWVCTFFCRTCGDNFDCDVDDEDRKEYL